MARGSSSKLHKCWCCEKSQTPESALIWLPQAIAGKRSQWLVFNAKSSQRTPTAWRDFTPVVRGRAALAHTLPGFSQHQRWSTDVETRRPVEIEVWRERVSWRSSLNSAVIKTIFFSRIWVKSIEGVKLRALHWLEEQITYSFVTGPRAQNVSVR